MVLRLANGGGCAKLLGEDVSRQALLLERLGAPMYDIVADPVIRHNLLCEAAVCLWRPIGPGIDLPTGAKLAEQYAGRLPGLWEQAGRPCSPATMADALDCMNRRRLAHDDRSAVLVHGDIHEMNALQASDGSYKLIDPAGLRAEPACDLGTIVRCNRTSAMTSGRGLSSWLLARAWMPPPSGNGEPSTESSAASTLAVSAFSPLAICCWPKRIASRRSHRIVHQSEPSVPGIIVGLASEERAVGADDHPSSKVNNGTDDERRAVRMVGTRDRVGARDAA